MEKIVEGFTQEKNSAGDFVHKPIRAALIKKLVTKTSEKTKELNLTTNAKKKKGRKRIVSAETL